MEKLHLDSEYRDRWVEFRMEDGTIEDSRLKNWRHVAWSKVTGLSVHICGNVHDMDDQSSGFRAFMNFRWGGQEALFNDAGKYTGHRPIKIWTIGWTDGFFCYLKDIDFYTGKFTKGYKAPLWQFSKHVHPDVKDKVKV